MWFGSSHSGTGQVKWGKIVAVYSDQNLLDHLNHKIKEHKLEFRVKTIKCSLFKLDFPPKTFDILWAEGSIYAIGFEKGLRGEGDR